MTTIGPDGETLAECEADDVTRKGLTLTMSMEVSRIQRWTGKHDWKSWLDTARCRFKKSGLKERKPFRQEASRLQHSAKKFRNTY